MLALGGIETTNHAIILDLGLLLLKVWVILPDPKHGILMGFYSTNISYLTHTSIEMYKRLVWESSIHMVERGEIGSIHGNSALIMMFRLVDSALPLR